MAERPYHHGNLRATLVAAAEAEIDEVGPTAMSLRKVAARAGVTHPSAAHHFGDKRGLLTALAATGHRGLADALAAARERGLIELGVAYLRFAGEHRAAFEVMFRPELLHRDDPDLVAAAAASRGELQGGTGQASGAAADLAHAAWGFVHGITTLWLAGNLPATTVDEAEALFRRAARTFGPPRPPRSARTEQR